MALKSYIPFLFPVILCGCFSCPSDRYLTFEDYRKSLPRRKTALPAAKKVLTLAEAQQFALAGNPDYLSAGQSVRAAKYRYYRSLSAYLPEVDFRAGAQHALKNSHDLLNPPAGVMPRERKFSADLGIYASLLVFDGLEREFTVLAARQETRRRQALDRNAKRLLVRAVAYAYYDAVLARETERIARADLSFQESSLRQAENRFRNGLVSKASVLNFRILANRAKSAVFNARYRGIAARNSLCALMGFPQEDFPPELELAPLQREREELYPSLEFCLEQAAANRPDLRAAAFLLDIAFFRKWSAYSGFLPTVRAEAGFGWGAENARYGGYQVSRSHHNTTGFTYGVYGEWNLFKGFSTFNLIRERIVEEELAKLHLSEMFLQAVNEVKDAWANYRNALEQVKIYEETLAWVYEQRQLVQSEYWNGRDTITRLNGAQSDLVEAESRLAIALIELRKAEVQLDAAMNRESAGE